MSQVAPKNSRDIAYLTYSTLKSFFPYIINSCLILTRQGLGKNHKGWKKNVWFLGQNLIVFTSHAETENS